MIPRRLKLRNFLSYRECEIDLSGLHTAVLAGKNGDGKSALLDSMTWALWNEARGRLDDERIRANAMETMVEFEFESRGERYVVIRRRTRSKSAKAGGVGSLELFQETEMGRKSLSGGVMTETQAEVTRRVGMDYATFAASAFIAQGKAGEFTKKAPRERKEVFRKVLGLEFYETLSKVATDRRKEATVQINTVTALTASSEAEIQRLPEIEADLAQIRSGLEVVAPALTDTTERLNQLRQLDGEYERLATAVATAQSRIERHEAEIATLSDTIAGAEQEAGLVEAMLGEREAVEAAYRELLAERDRDRSLAALQVSANELDRTIQEARGAIDQERARLESRLESLRTEVVTLEKAAGGATALTASVAVLDREAEAIAAFEATISEGQRARATLKELASGALAESEGHRQQAQALKDREAQLSEPGAPCPICRQPLGVDDVAHVREEYRAERKRLGDCYAAARAAATEANARAAELEERLARDTAESEAREKDLGHRRSAIDREMGAAREAANQLPGRRDALDEVEGTLAAATFAIEARAALDRATAARAAISYNAEEHAAIRARLDALGEADRKHREMELAAQRAASLATRLAEIGELFTRKAAEREEARAEFEAASANAELAFDVGPQVRAAEEELASLRRRESELTEGLGRLKASLDNLRLLAAKVEMAEEQVRSYRDEEQTYGDLGKAFGRDGVQAMLIDQALPRLEQVANEMLERMTAGRISVSLSTQKVTAGGNIQETLDIQIRDELGDRSYEMYSGGEAFRVDFAIRIALAKLLAERSGAELPTLIIDEGFGSQDSEGIDRLVEAINSVSEDFRLILVVTHVEELRERFERRIEVTKDPERGSFARVV